jgi:LuxR family transcriptional regulator (chaperone HchA-associated)
MQSVKSAFMLENNAIRTAITIESSKNPLEVQVAVRQFATSYGYNRYVFYSASVNHDAIIDRIFWVEGDWFNGEEVDELTYMRRCPVTQHILETDEPFYWIKCSGQTGEQYRVVRKPQGSGVHGLQIPVFGLHGLEGAASFGGEKIDTSSEARLSIQLVAVTAFYTLRRMKGHLREQTEGTLSKREREVLAWTAAGRRQADIAVTLGISPRTVENHLRAARQRLGVATTVEAIRMAVRNGDIEG